MTHKIGIIGGSGLEKMDLLTDPKRVDIDTPWGKPSAAPLCGKIDGIEVVMIPRHGAKHEYSPTNLPYRANIHAFKEMGCSIVVSATAVGSLCEEMAPGDLVLMDQFIDRTTQRTATFYDKIGAVCHISTAVPFCAPLRRVLYEVSKDFDVKCHEAGTIVTIEGPRFSTRAESFMFRQWGANLVGMTASTEASLVREAGMHYVSVAMVTDYDCWRDSSEEHVSVEAVLQIMKKNGDIVTKLIEKAIPIIGKHNDWACPCVEAIKLAQM